MAAYVIGHIRVRDPEKWALYRAGVPATLVPFGGELVLRGRTIEAIGGAHDFGDAVVLRFPDSRAIRAWHDSPAYQALVPLRQEAAEVLLITYEGAA